MFSRQSSCLVLLPTFHSPATKSPERRPRFQAGSLRARRLAAGAVDKAGKPARQLGDAVRLPHPDSFPGDQLRADAEGNGPRQNEATGRLLIDSAGGDEGHIWKHGLQSSDVTVTAHLCAGNHLDEVGTHLPRPHYLARSKCSWDHDCTFLHREVHDLRIKAVAGQEFGPGVQTAARRFYIRDTARADNHLDRKSTRLN